MGEYADVLERALYNGALSGMSENGKRFFYVNPLEVQPEVCGKREDHKHVKTTRQKWFGCACCPPNLARLLASIGSYIYSHNDQQLYVNLYADSQADFNFQGQKVRIIQKTNYPWSEEIELEISCEQQIEFELALRIPGWCRKAALQVNGRNIDLREHMKAGYAKIKRNWKNDRIKLILKMPVEKMYANPKIREDIDRVSLQRGPIVYALEEVDNGRNLPAIFLAEDAELEAEYKKDLLGGVAIIKGSAFKLDEKKFGEGLYNRKKPEFKKIDIQAVPYYAWDNRESGEMLVWINQK